jgi:hypothetical protein
MVLSEVRHIFRDVLVWASWTLLQGTPFHGKSYGELVRLSPLEVAKHVATMLVALSGLIWIYLFMPSNWYGIYFSSISIFVFSGVFLVLFTYALTWALDRQLTYL